MKARRILWAACGLAVAAALGLWLFRWQEGRGAPLAGPIAASQAASAVGGPFQLVDQNGAPRDQSLLQGRWTAVFFGFTHCPDICPTTLQTLGAVQEALPADRRLQLVLVTVDPARDTPASLKTYLDNQAFPRGVVGLTGTDAQVAAAARAYTVDYRRVGEGDAYVMDHTSFVFLMDPQGRLNRLLHMELGPERLAAQVREAQGAASPGGVARNARAS